MVFLLLFQCQDQGGLPRLGHGCSEEATVVDLTGLDGCGLVFELKDGTRLNPLRLTYIQPPRPDEDPIFYYEMKAGARVKIGYRDPDEPYGDVCMAARIVFITCIEPLGIDSP